MEVLGGGGDKVASNEGGEGGDSGKGHRRGGDFNAGFFSEFRTKNWFLTTETRKVITKGVQSPENGGSATKELWGMGLKKVILD